MFEEIENSWSEDSADYDAIVKKQLADRRSVRYWTKELQKRLGKKPLHILDVGCGPGFLTILLTRLGHKVKAIDGSSGMVACANKNFAAEGIAGYVKAYEEDAVRLPQEEAESYDVIISRDVVWTLYDPKQAFRRWQEVLKPGGQLLYYDVTFRDWKRSSRLRFRKKISNVLIFITEHGKIYREDVDQPVGAFANLPFYKEGIRPRIDYHVLKRTGFVQIRINWDAFRNNPFRIDFWKYGYSGKNFCVEAKKETM